MTEPTYYKLKRKLERIQKWIYQKEVEPKPEWMKPETLYIRQMLKELQEILDDEETKKAQG